jgi:hypothetical protein
MEQKRILVFIFFISLFVSCKTNNEINIEKTDKLILHNIIIISDVTNRITSWPKPIHDTVIIDNLIDYFNQEIIRPGILTNPRHIIQFYNLNPFKQSNCNGISKIDLFGMRNSIEKSKYVNSKSIGNTLNNDLLNLKETIQCQYKTQDKSGDILNSLNQIFVLDENIMNSQPKYDSILEASQVWENDVFLFTDGYLEFNNMKNSKFSTPSSKIIEIRKLCLQNKKNPTDILDTYPNLKIEPILNKAFNHIKLHILETYDRGIDKTTGISKEAISDEIILKSLWNKWALESGFPQPITYYSFIKKNQDIKNKIITIFKN